MSDRCIKDSFEECFHDCVGVPPCPQSVTNIVICENCGSKGELYEVCLPTSIVTLCNDCAIEEIQNAYNNMSIDDKISIVDRIVKNHKFINETSSIVGINLQKL